MWFKTKKEKEQKLQAELKALQDKYSEVINSYCKIGNYFFILKGFKIEDNKIYVRFIDEDTTTDCISYISLDGFWIQFGTLDFKVARYQFIKFKDDLRKIGLKLEKFKEL